MPNISQRGVEMPASPIRKLAPLADAPNRGGVHVYHRISVSPTFPLRERHSMRSVMSIVRCWNIALVRDIADYREKLDW